MSFLSLRTALSTIGEPKGSVVSVPSDFKSTPGKSLKDIANAMMLLPRPEQWVQANESHKNEHWTEEVQGVTWDGSHFYFSANDAGKPGSPKRTIYRFVGNGDVETVLEMDEQYGKHLGALDFFGGKLFCAMEGPVGVLVVDPQSGSAVRHSLKNKDGGPPPQKSMPWCAVNPWNKLLYSSENGDDAPTPTIHAYDPTNGFRNVPTAQIELAPHPARHVQGGCFSAHGHLYLATDQRDPNAPEYKLLRAYSAFNGYFLGAARVLALEDDQELEDCCYAPMTINDAAVQIHVVLLENETWDPSPGGPVPDMDNIFFKHFSAPTPSAV